MAGKSAKAITLQPAFWASQRAFPRGRARLV